MDPLPPIITDATGRGARKVYHAGTLTYTKVGLAMLFFWLLWGDFCYQVMEAATPSIIPWTLQALNASNEMMGLIMVTIPMSMGLVLNPVISVKSDRFRSRWGRRIPFIFLGLPFLVVTLIALGYGGPIAVYLHHSMGPAVAKWSPQTMALLTISVLMVLFSFFNTFVNSVYWYLFNDVVPEHLLARFMSCFRLVSMGAGAFYNGYVFGYSDRYATWIFVGAALLYFVGFGLMCLNVKEGKYPPPAENIDGHSGFLSTAKTYLRECHCHRIYWLQFISAMSGACGSSIGFLGVFGSSSLGLDRAQIGKLAMIGGITGAILIPVSGWLADRYHPLRVVLTGSVLGFLVTPTGFIWLFWHPSPTVVFWYSIATIFLWGAPIGALNGIADPPLLMRLFPRSRYGQFCSANNLWRSLGAAIGAPLGGVYLDFVKNHCGSTSPYFFMPYWNLAFGAITVFCMGNLYRTWKKLGGDLSYEPPLPKEGPSFAGTIKEEVNA